MKKTLSKSEPPAEGRNGGPFPKSNDQAFLFFLQYCRLNGIRTYRTFMENLEKNLLEQTMKKARGNQRAASSFLGMKYSTLNEKLKRHALREEKKPAFRERLGSSRMI
jgi:DNA-binding protein Fis